MKRQFRLGSTSYVHPADILTNARKLAPLVDDIELVLFEVEDYGTNLPDAAVVAELNALAQDQELTYTVHLPLDLDWRDPRSFKKIFRALDATCLLNPFAYILHLDGRGLRGKPTPAVVAHWQAESGRALDQILTHVNARRWCIENLEAWSPEYFGDLIQVKHLTRCVDVGHFWLQRSDPLAHLEEHIARTRVIHMHGVHIRDHQSLVHQPRGEVTEVLDFLTHAQFAGVVTLSL